MILAFTVYGVAEAKGSMRPRSFRLGDGRIITKVTDSNRNVSKWQALIRADASRALSLMPAGDRAVLDGPVRLTVAFYLPRPKEYAKRGGQAHLTAPDWDKLSRAVGDALTGLVYRDDKQIVEAFIAKFYADVDDVPHVEIRVESTAGVGRSVVPPAPLPLFELAR
jgi:crossover junction endodeoxyribonuclease RusA